VRLNRYVAAGSGLSRRAADAAVAASRVLVNGQLPSTGQDVTTGDSVTLDGQTLQPPQSFTYLALHKPVGYVSSRTRQGKHPTVYDLLPPKYHMLQLAGRLDLESSGLMLLSNDGNFILAMSHPSAGKTKIYEVVLDKLPKPGDLEQLDHGVMLSDGSSRLHILSHDGRNVELSLQEGRNRQIRRTFGALGYSVQTLHRQSIGPHQLGDLAAGAWREFRL
jgi:23S rRNA pseudouridine2605 synthase